MNEEYIDNVKHLIEQKDADTVKGLLIDLHPADIAELCNDLNPEEAKFIYRLLDNEIAADVLVEMDEDARKELLEMLPSETIAKRFVDYMDTDDAVDLMRELDEDKQEEVLSHIEDIEQAGDIVDLLKYDENTAGGLMGTEMVLVNENWSMPECLKEMRQQAEELDEIYYVYVIDDDEHARTMFTFSNASGVASMIVCFSPLNSIVLPALFALARNFISLYCTLSSTRILRISLPTTPVAPRTAMLGFLIFTSAFSYIQVNYSTKSAEIFTLFFQAEDGIRDSLQ